MFSQSVHRVSNGEPEGNLDYCLVLLCIENEC